MIQFGFSYLKIWWAEHLKPQGTYELHGICGKAESDQHVWGGGLRACISHKLLGEAGAPGPQMHKAAEAAAQITATWQSSQGS